MNRNHTVPLLAALLGSLLPLAPNARAQATATAAEAGAQGVITGTITNAATGRTLEGARVSLKGTNREVYTDKQGTFRLTNVPVGEVTLEVAYTGLDAVAKTIAVSPVGATRHDVGLTSNVYTLGEVRVAGEREGNAQAITLQRVSPGVKSIVSADAFGNLAGNPADLLIRLPGVEGQSMDGDIRYVRIRGMSQNLNTVTINGNRAANAASAGTTREYQFEHTNADAIERMEVVKSPTPDMDADSIGGAVNMVTKSAFDSSGERRISGSIGSMWRPWDPRDTKLPQIRSYSLNYSEVYKEKFGVAINLGYRVVPSLLSESMLSYQQVPNDSNGPAYLYQADWRDSRIKRARGGVNLKLDYKLNDEVRFYLTGSADKSDERKDQYREQYQTNQSVAGVDANGNYTGTGGIIPGYTEGITKVRAVSASNVQLTPEFLNKQAKSNYLQLGAVHKYPTVDLDYDIYQSFAETNYPGTRSMSFIARNIGFNIEKRDNPFFPYITQTAGADLTKLSTYNENLYSSTIRNGKDRYVGAALNATKRFDTALPTWVKVGGRIRRQNRDLTDNSYRGTYVGPDGVMGVNPASGQNDDNLSQFGRGFAVPNTELSRYATLPYANFGGNGRQGIDTVFAQSPQLFKPDVVSNTTIEYTGKQNFQETITAAYLMGNVTLGKFSLLAGVRVEKTDVYGEGALQYVSPAEKARRASWVGTVTPVEQERRIRAEYSGRKSARGSTQDYFPGVHLKYAPSRNLIARLSYATNVGRPSIGQLVPRTTINDDSQTISTANPNLKAQRASNYDLGAEYYFEPAGVVSVSVFRKDISRFIYTASGAVVTNGPDNGFDGNYVGYVLTTQYNGGSARIDGFELNYNQQFTKLPGFWSGFGAFATFTKMKINGDYESGGTLQSTSEVPGFNPMTANAGISYIRGRATVRLQYNYTDQFLSSYSDNKSRLWYTMRRRTVDMKAMYRFTEKLDGYLDLNNIFDEPDSGSVWYGGRSRNIKEMSPLVSLGMNFRL
jgi:iron complex outermembrane receptor protein